jgi:DEAD/DEAH box helicase
VAGGGVQKGSRKNPVRTSSARVSLVVGGRGDGLSGGGGLGGGLSAESVFRAEAFSALAQSSHLWGSRERFADLGLGEEVVLRLESAPDAVGGERAVARRGLGLRAPTRTQRVGIPAVLSGRDLLVRAETGSGKTLAYLVPIAIRAEQARFQPGIHPIAVILVPSKELVQQVYGMIERQMPSLAPHVRPILGATGPSRSDRFLVAVGTPRGILDVRRGRVGGGGSDGAGMVGRGVVGCCADNTARATGAR